MGPKDPSPAAPTNEHEGEVLNMNVSACVWYFVLALAWRCIRWHWFEGGGGVVCMWGAEVASACPNVFSMSVGSTEGR